eukprot:g3287.t1
MLGASRTLLGAGARAHWRPTPLARCFAQAAMPEDPSDDARAPPRIVTAASLFDGHDASINVMRRLIQSAGAEVIHLAHDRSALDVVNAIIQEDAHAVALTSYQGGHTEYFTYIRQLLQDAGCGHVHIYGGGGGTITPPEIRDLHDAGITRIYSPEDGRRMGLLGMIDEVVLGASTVDCSGVDILTHHAGAPAVTAADHPQVARLLTVSENDDHDTLQALLARHRSRPEGAPRAPVVGLTGTGGAGKSSLLDELMLRVLRDNPNMRVALLCVDPTRKRTGGALLGDRIRMNSLANERLFMRSLASRSSQREVSERLSEAIEVCQATGFDFIFVETSGIGQGNDAITEYVDRSLYVMTPEFGAETQLEKIEMLDVADFVVLNKFERRGAMDALHAVRKQVRRNRELYDVTDAELPVLATIASQFADPSIDLLWQRLAAACVLADGSHPHASAPARPANDTDAAVNPPAEFAEQLHRTRRVIIPAERSNYLADIAGAVRGYHEQTRAIERAQDAADALDAAHALVPSLELAEAAAAARAAADEAGATALLAEYSAHAEMLRAGEFVYHVRGREIRQPATTTSLAQQQIPRIALPREGTPRSAVAGWLRRENIPGSFPYTAGVFPLKRTDEEPKRQFAGEGPAARTNARFHYLSKGDDAKRLSTAFDSVTLYGRDPDERPDIYGKVGNSGVSIFTVEEMSQLFEGFDLCHPSTSVSMTINGPAPAILAMYFNAAMRQQESRFEQENGRAPGADESAAIKAATLSAVRGTVQADILKEDQAQNTCIFSTEFSLRMMGDVQQYYIDHGIKNHYSVSISGYHIAEAGANPITQLALTLANGFTYAEYYRSRGMDINAFAPNLSFFFSNGLDPEYTVIGRVARRIWAVAMRELYGADERSQKLKYHIQTSGRSLHAQEVQFNDIRTTLQALLAIQDACNSLHTNAYDEAVTTPTEESVRRAMAIQMIVNRESGWTKCENPLQGSFLADELTDLVEEAVLQEFDRLSARGGVLGAMETMYQRSKIQDESMHYEHLKHSGELPLIGVNTYINEEELAAADDADSFEMELIRSTDEEKQGCITRRDEFHARHAAEAPAALARLQQVAREGGNVFEELMETVKVASLGQITDALFQVGGQYRRSM